jgi:hypothetical protein
MTIEQKIASADKLLQWLKQKYPLPEVEIVPMYTRKPWLRKKGIAGSMWQSGNIGMANSKTERPLTTYAR